MNHGRKPILLALPTISAVETYLRSKGWSKVTPPDPARANPNVRVYKGSTDAEGNPLTVILPARSDLIDAKRRVSDVVRFLAALEAKTPNRMAQEIIVRGRPSAFVKKSKPSVVGVSLPKRTASTVIGSPRTNAKAKATR